VVTIKIRGMSCEHCEAAVAEALSAVPGVTNVEVRLKKLWEKESIATCEGVEDEIILWAAVEEAGYEPVEITFT